MERRILRAKREKEKKFTKINKQKLTTVES